ncbi:MAG: glycosyltransferase family 9 protein, partial [Planctomycetota bacterium]
HLLSGNYIEGWKGYRRRRNTDLKALTDYHRSGKPRWDGSSFEGKRLFVHYEQGLGDNIQFIRYLPMVKARGGTVIFETIKPLIGLLQGFPGVDELVEYFPDKKSSVDFDVYTSLLDMPNIFGTTLETIPAEVPYIRAEPAKTQYWRNRLAGPDFKVGIVWAGSPVHGNDRYRSCILACFEPLTKIAGLQLYGLQKGKAAAQMDELAETIPLTNISKEFGDFTDTAAAIENLDIVISVDTSVLHLAGAMGKPVWALLPFAPEWRWMLNREDSPWYPTMRLFRQRSWSQWDPVFQQVAEELRIIVAWHRIARRRIIE